MLSVAGTRQRQKSGAIIASTGAISRLMKAAELRSRKPEELNELLVDLLREQFNLRMQKGSGQLGSPGRFRVVRREIARIKTVLNEKAKQDE